MLETDDEERWVNIPASEYNHLLSDPEVNAIFICNRIVDHVESQGKVVNFDNLFFETQTWHKMNNCDIVRYDDEDEEEVIHSDHRMGKNTSKFLAELIIKMIIRTNEHDLLSQVITSNNFTLKISKKR